MMARLLTTVRLEPIAFWDRKSQCYYGRVNVHAGSTLAYYMVVRIGRVTKAEALEDAQAAVYEALDKGYLF